MSFREPNGVVMTANMKLPGWKRRIAASSLRGRLGTNQNGQAAKEKKQNVVAGGGYSENTSCLPLRGERFSLCLPLYRSFRCSQSQSQGGYDRKRRFPGS